MRSFSFHTVIEVSETPTDMLEHVNAYVPIQSSPKDRLENVQRVLGRTVTAASVRRHHQIVQKRSTLDRTDLVQCRVAVV